MKHEKLKPIFWILIIALILLNGFLLVNKFFLKNETSENDDTNVVEIADENDVVSPTNVANTSMDIKIVGNDKVIQGDTFSCEILQKDGTTIILSNIELEWSLDGKNIGNSRITHKKELPTNIHGKHRLIVCLLSQDNCAQLDFEVLRDTDGDKVPDYLDQCPETKQGEYGENGCPDLDNDGFIDINDKCPEIFGIHEGCPKLLGCTNPSSHNYNSKATEDNGTCKTCSDGIKNGDELATDCGGSICIPCKRGCPEPNSHNYVLNPQIKVPCQTCGDSKKNGNETGIDCGGRCKPCQSSVNNTKTQKVNKVASTGNKATVSKEKTNTPEPISNPSFSNYKIHTVATKSECDLTNFVLGNFEMTIIPETNLELEYLKLISKNKGQISVSITNIKTGIKNSKKLVINSGDTEVVLTGLENRFLTEGVEYKLLLSGTDLELINFDSCSYEASIPGVVKLKYSNSTVFHHKLKISY